MSDELKCPVCGRELQIYWEIGWHRVVCWDSGNHVLKFNEYKTKRGAINAAKRLLAKLKGGE